MLKLTVCLVVYDYLDLLSLSGLDLILVLILSKRAGCFKTPSQDENRYSVELV